ncbi:MAG: hypothetical protein ACQKBV_02795 [Puniceicoccales bacterium]
MDYDLLAKDHVFHRICGLSDDEQDLIFAWMDALKVNPFTSGDYVDATTYAGPNEVKLLGRFAAVYYVDHAVKEIKVLDLVFADEIES